MDEHAMYRMACPEWHGGEPTSDVRRDCVRRGQWGPCGGGTPEWTWQVDFQATQDCVASSVYTWPSRDKMR